MNVGNLPCGRQKGVVGAKFSCSAPKQIQIQSVVSQKPVSVCSITSQQNRCTAVRSLTIRDKAFAALPYVLPLCDCLRYGKFLLNDYPYIFNLLAPVMPLIGLYYTIPLGSLITFFAVYLGLVQNYNQPRFVRFNAMQAVLLDIVLIIPSVFEQMFSATTLGVEGSLGGIGLELKILLYNTIFLFVFVSFAYGVGCCLTGQLARLPYLSEAADQQLR